MGQLFSPAVVQLLVDAGVNTMLTLQMENATGGVDKYGSPLAYTDERFRVKKARGKDLTEAQLRRLEAVRRLLFAGGSSARRFLDVAQQCRRHCPG